jgi:hypothetical protein
MPEITSYLEFYPNRSKVVQFVNKDGTPFVLPGGTAVAGAAVNRLRSKIATMQPTIADGSKGLVNIVLEDTATVRRNINKLCSFNLQLTLPGGLKKNLGATAFVVLDDFMDAVEGSSLPSYTPGGVTGSSSGAPGVTPQAPTILYVQDQVWVTAQGQKVQVTIEKQPNGSQLFKLTEVT